VGVSLVACGESRLPQGGLPATATSGGDGGEGEGGEASSASSTKASTAAAGGAGGAGGSTCMLNAVKDGDETDVDCGGSCPGCEVGQGCMTGSDCEELSCVADMCASPTCMDMVKNGDETGMDCGGPMCGDCPPGQGCIDDFDCDSGVCFMMLCQMPSCTDGIKNGSETDVDCGGMTCPSDCLAGKSCMANTDCVTNICTQLICSCPAEMEIAPVLGGGAYCIDKTEVTYAQYELFWTNNPTPSGQIAACQWNMNYTPDANWPNSNKQHPVTNVDWCDAYAYCTYAGKHLCGKIGGGANLYTDYVDTTKSEWFNACSALGTNNYPYSDTYDPNACNGLDYTGSGTVAVQNTAQQPLTTPPCQGGIPDLWQMSGNVREWEDSCDNATGPNDACRTRGGSYLSIASELLCNAPASETRDSSAVDIGFRCCL
jgi:hypothetical protein